MFIKLLTIAVVASMNVGLANATEKAPKMDFEIDLPTAEGIQKGTMVFSQSAHESMNGYFTKINSIPAPEIKISPDINEATIGESTINTIMHIDMLDSAFSTLDSGVKYALVETLVECCGVFIFQEGVGSGATHVSTYTNLESLKPLLNCFNLKNEVSPVVTIATSYKSSLLCQVYKYLTQANFTPTYIFSTNIIFQQSLTGTTVKKFFNPNDLKYTKADLKKIKNAKNDEQRGHIIMSMIDENDTTLASPVDLLMDLSTGKVYWPGSNFQNRRRISQAITAFNTRKDPSLKETVWAQLRHERVVKPKQIAGHKNPLEKQDLAFVKYPVVEPTTFF